MFDPCGGDYGCNPLWHEVELLHLTFTLLLLKDLLKDSFPTQKFSFLFHLIMVAFEQKVGEMMEPRAYHGAAVIDYKTIEKYCIRK